MKSLNNLIKALKGDSDCNCANGVAIGQQAPRGGWQGKVTIS
jgi:hypothetical protein